MRFILFLNRHNSGMNISAHLEIGGDALGFISSAQYGSFINCSKKGMITKVTHHLHRLALIF